MMIRSRDNGKDIPNGCTSAFQNNLLNVKGISKKQVCLE